MPGVFQMSVDVARAVAGAKRAEEGFGAYLVFGVIDRAKKDAIGSPALDEDNVVCRLLREAKRRSSRWRRSPTCASASTPATATAGR